MGIPLEVRGEEGAFMSHHFRRLLAMLACGALSVLGFGAPAHAASNGRIVYLSEYGSGSVYIVEALAGATPTQIGPAPVGRPAFAPDATRIAAITMAGDVLTFLPDGGGMTTVATGASGDHVTPAWSPDTTRLAYFKGTYPDYSLVMRPSTPGGTEEVVTQIGNYPTGSISWSPDGATLLYSTFDGMWSVSAKPGSTPSKLTIPGSAGMDDFGPSWSPDGSRFAFARSCVMCADPLLAGLWTASADGSTPQQLVSAGVQTPPSWSPDGTKIAFSTVDVNNAIVIANSTGAGQTGTVVTAGPGLGSPSWGPVPEAPKMVSAPKVTGAVAYGNQLSTDKGVWTGSPTAYKQQWQRCTPGKPASCVDISGAAASTYTVGQADLGKALRTQVKAANALGETADSSDLVSVPKLPSGKPVAMSAVPKTLTASGGKNAKVKVPCATTAKDRVTSCTVTLSVASKDLAGRSSIGTATVTSKNGKTKLTAKVKLNSAGMKMLSGMKKGSSVSTKVSINLVAKRSKKGSEYCSSSTNLARKVKKG